MVDTERTSASPASQPPSAIPTATGRRGCGDGDEPLRVSSDG